MPPFPEIRLPAPASGPPTTIWPASFGPDTARDAAAPVPEGHGAGGVGADQIALHETVNVGDAPCVVGDAIRRVARDQVAGGRRRPADGVALRLDDDSAAAIGIRRELLGAGGIGANVIALDQIVADPGTVGVDADLHPLRAVDDQAANRAIARLDDDHSEPHIAGILAVDLDEQFAVEPLADGVRVGCGARLGVAVDRYRVGNGG